MGCNNCFDREGEKVDYVITDCQKIQEIAKDMGYTISLLQAKHFWLCRSYDWEASWLTLPKEDSVLRDDINQYIEHYQIFKRPTQGEPYGL